MWCTECHTAFSWRTGVIVRGTIHNPHYFEYMRSRSNGRDIPRQPGDVPERCNERARLTVWEFERTIGRTTVSRDDEVNVYKKALLDVMRSVIHVREVDLRAANLQEPGGGVLLDLRRKFLMGDIDQGEWRRSLLLNEKKRERIVAFRQVYEVLCIATDDILRTVTGEKESMSRAADELRGLFSFTKEALEKVAKRFACSIPRQPPDMDFLLEFAREYVRKTFDSKRRRVSRAGEPPHRAFVDLTMDDST